MSSIAYTSPMITQDCPVIYALEVTLYLEDPSMGRSTGTVQGTPLQLCIRVMMFPEDPLKEVLGPDKGYL